MSATHRHNSIYVSSERYDADEKRRDAVEATTREDLREIKDSMKFFTRTLFAQVLGLIVVGGLFGYFTFVKGA